MKRNIVKLLVGTSFIVAFDNRPGWKMEGDNIAVDGEGNPIYVDGTGREQSIKQDTIVNLNSEAKNHRVAKETAEASLAKYKGADGKLIDPDAAIKAIETVANIDAKKLIDAGEVERVREEIKGQFTTQLTEKDAALTQANQTIHSLRIDAAFDGSEFVRDRLAVPKDMFRDSFGRNVKVGDDGKLEYYGRDNNRLMSKKHVGEYATGDEAFELMVEQHPQKDTILKANGAEGSGNEGGGGNRGGGRRMTRAEFDGLPPMKQAEAAQAQMKGELTIND